MIGGHGGNIYHLARRLGCRPVDISDMSANVNPLGPMPALMDHLKARLTDIAALPEVDADGIAAGFAGMQGVAPSQIMAGNGSTELIYLIPRALGIATALVVGPTYADYQDACSMSRVTCNQLIGRKRDHFLPDMQALGKAARGADLVFLCNPNNPTGTWVNREALQALCRSLPDTLFVIDESYLPFVPDPESISMIRSDLPNLMVLNSMSKAFRIPGLRIGFVKAPAALIEKLAAFRLPWSVNSLAQAAVNWLMTHPEAVAPFLAETRRVIEEEKRGIEEYIHQKSKIHCFPSVTSFMLMRLPDGVNASTVWQHMADNRILIRDCSNFTGLSRAYIRMSLKTTPENRRAAELLVRFCRDRCERGTGHVI